MSILDYFQDEKISILIERKTGGTTTNDVLTTASWTTVDTYNGLYWEGSAATAFISERFKDRTTAVVALEYGSDVKRGDRITANSKQYKALDPDDIAVLNDVIIVALEVFG